MACLSACHVGMLVTLSCHLSMSCLVNVSCWHLTSDQHVGYQKRQQTSQQPVMFVHVLQPKHVQCNSVMLIWHAVIAGWHDVTCRHDMPTWRAMVTASMMDQHNWLMWWSDETGRCGMFCNLYWHCFYVVIDNSCCGVVEALFQEICWEEHLQNDFLFSVQWDVKF